MSKRVTTLALLVAVSTVCQGAHAGTTNAPLTFYLVSKQRIEGGQLFKQVPLSGTGLHLFKARAGRRAHQGGEQFAGKQPSRLGRGPQRRDQKEGNDNRCRTLLFYSTRRRCRPIVEAC
jgi:hypothetical protein